MDGRLDHKCALMTADCASTPASRVQADSAHSEHNLSPRTNTKMASLLPDENKSDRLWSTKGNCLQPNLKSEYLANTIPQNCGVCRLNGCDKGWGWRLSKMGKIESTSASPI